ncbi:MAG: HAMP domain-containing protein, partial [Zoogloeaceae bacterium]|nr:HAMP domain-containing protein [Zoogloeaceae bacterium]
MRLVFMRNASVRAKLIVLFVLVKVIPLIAVALIAWQGVAQLSEKLGKEADEQTRRVSQTIDEMSRDFAQESETALNARAREEMERLTTDTARQIAQFLYDRDEDIQQAALLPLDSGAYRNFLKFRLKRIVDPGQWALSPDRKSWLRLDVPHTDSREVSSSNPENRYNFHYRPPETVQPDRLVPLFREITFVGTDGKEKLKATDDPAMDPALRDVSRREDTYAHAETYFSELQKLKPGEIYVSDVIGTYVPSRIIGMATPEAAKARKIPFEPEKEAFAGAENPVGKRFLGIIRWATPVVRGGKIIGWVTLALNHDHLLAFTDNILPSAARYTALSDATQGNYAYLWDYQGRSIAHPRHYSIVGFDAQGEPQVPWLEDSIYQGWKKSGLPLPEYLAGMPTYDRQSRDKQPAPELTVAGLLGLDCRWLNFAPQCTGWRDLTQYGGSGSFLNQWADVWKIDTAATIPYYTGHYGKSPRGFGFVAIGSNIDDYQKPAKETARQMNHREQEFTQAAKERQSELHRMIDGALTDTTSALFLSTLAMTVVVIFIAIWLAGVLARRVTQLIEGLRRIEAGDFSHHFQKTANDEVGLLADSLNRMAESIQQSFQRESEARKSAEETSQMKSAFLARMSHELRTPLNGILGFAELIESDAQDEETKEGAAAIHKSGLRLLKLVSDILELAKLEGGAIRLEQNPMGLASFLRDTANAWRVKAEAKGLKLELDLSGKPPAFVIADAARLRQALDCLLDNALKFTEQGAITLSARIEAAQSGARLVFCVADTGPGVAPEARAALFDSFRQEGSLVTRQQGGSGLGLALLRALATLMGGEVGVDAENDQPGARFYFW